MLICLLFLNRHSRGFHQNFSYSSSTKHLQCYQLTKTASETYQIFKYNLDNFVTVSSCALVFE